MTLAAALARRCCASISSRAALISSIRIGSAARAGALAARKSRVKATPLRSRRTMGCPILGILPRLGVRNYFLTVFGGLGLPGRGLAGLTFRGSAPGGPGLGLDGQLLAGRQAADLVPAAQVVL